MARVRSAQASRKERLGAQGGAGAGDRSAVAERNILENYYFVLVFRHAFMSVIVPRIAATKWQDVFSELPDHRLRLSVGGPSG